MSDEVMTVYLAGNGREITTITTDFSVSIRAQEANDDIVDHDEVTLTKRQWLDLIARIRAIRLAKDMETPKQKAELAGKRGLLNALETIHPTSLTVRMESNDGVFVGTVYRVENV